MLKLKNKEKEYHVNFLRRILDLSHFSSSKEKEPFIIRTLKGLDYPDPYIRNVLRKKVGRDYTNDQLDKLMGDYIGDFKSICDLGNFTKDLQILDGEAYRFSIGKGEKSRFRTILLKEYQFILCRLTRKIYKDKKHNTFISYKYFTSTGAADGYKERTKRSVSVNKLNHIYKVLEYYRFIKRNFTNGKAVSYQIGPANPYYCLACIPDIDKLNNVNIMNRNDKMYKDAFIAIQAEVVVKDAEIAGLKKRLAERHTTQPEPKPEKTLSEIEITKQAELLERENLAGQNIEQEQEHTFLSSMGIMDDGTIITSKRDRIPYDYLPDNQRSSQIGPGCSKIKSR